MSAATRPVSVPPSGLAPDPCSAAALRPARLPSELLASAHTVAVSAFDRFLAAPRLPEPRILSREYLETHCFINDQPARVVWHVLFGADGLLNDCIIDSVEADGRELSPELVPDEHVAFATDWAGDEYHAFMERD